MFCDGACRQAAYRRRKAGVPEHALPHGGQAGHRPLRASFERELLAEAAAELREARQVLEEGPAPGWLAVSINGGQPVSYTPIWTDDEA